MQLVQLDVRLVREMLFTSDGKSILVAGVTSLPHSMLAVHRFDVAGLSKPVRSQLPSPMDRAIALHQSGRFAFCSRDQIVYDLPWDEREVVHVVALDGGANGHVNVRHVGQSESVRTVFELAFTTSGDRIAMSCNFHGRRDIDSDSGVIVWDIGAERELKRFSAGGRPGAVLLSPDDRTLVVANNWGDILWTFDVPTGYFQTIENVDTRRIAVSSSGKYLAAAGRRIVIWDLEGMYRECFFRGQDEDVPGLAFSPDERILAVARTDGPVQFWDVQSGQLVRQYDWHIGRLGAIAFAPDGLTCAVAGDRGRIVIWDVDV